MDVKFKGFKTRHITTWANLQHGVLAERSQAQRPQCVVYLYEMSSTGTPTVTVSEFVEKGLGVTAKRDRTSFWSGMFWN